MMRSLNHLCLAVQHIRLTKLGNPPINTWLLPQTTQHQIQVRHSKHWIPKWKRLRAQKVIKIEVPNLEEKNSDLTEDEIRTRMKERGLLPPRPWMERPFSLTATSEIFEAYIPPEGDGKMSAISKEGAKQKLKLLEKKSKSMLAIRKIKSFEDDFDAALFAETAQSIYIKAHEALANGNKYKLREFVTERAYPEMMHNTKDKTVVWKFLMSLEPPRVVHARCTSLIDKENMFGQVTVRFHSQQTLAIYDRFGRLMFGSEFISKDVLEYFVYEKHLANEYGMWKIHGKIFPNWMPARLPSATTYTSIEK